MFCTVSLHLENSGKNLALNPKSVIFSKDKYFVVKQTAPRKYAVVPVNVVRSTPEYTYVTGNLKDGDQVVTEGSLLLFNDLTD
ncbi:efflux RND transporter periplasmic adaptor subunit [Hymenobacter sp. BRD67]|uniref:efflux RND transporter periplasmic adaptor subunit n=1 Tax=Hymenobacter sp. BRD67 TaxID=2675877 RepID=UPI001564F986|nr:efflux RND transporter periplasmic adaptor subunit [Hymenobacter sp. BRD67]QKG52042.1 efflux RND transporter periplasmic adaptor subunit [Hymenobacter sp. BRD67]